MTKDISKILNYVKANQAITTISEVMAEFPELTAKDLNTPEITKLLQQNKIKMQTALKIKLFKSNTTQSLLELNSILDKENNNDKTSKYISKIVKEWASNELQ